MDKADVAKSYKLGDRITSDVIVSLKKKGGEAELFYSHSSVLISKSKLFAEKLREPKQNSSIEIHCSDFDYNYHVELLRRLYHPRDSLVDSWDSVKSALGILQVAAALCCEEITLSCIQYLEAVHWEDNEEQEILEVASKLGPIAMPILARIQPVGLNATKSVLLSAIRFATSGETPCPPFGDELKVSAQEQVEYMLGEDDDIPLVIADEEVKKEVRSGLSKIFLSFEKDLSFVLLEADLISEEMENKITRTLADLEWMCNLLPKMDLMKDFVANWAEHSSQLLSFVEDKKVNSHMWGFKVKVIEMTAKVLEAVGYGNVVFPALCRVGLLKAWLPYIRKMKPLLDSLGSEDASFTYKMDEDLWQSIEGAIVSMILALPSSDQSDILSDWMRSEEQVRYPDLSEAFEVWCYRTKSAKRRLLEGLDRVGEGNNHSNNNNTTLSL